jgi:hypothetical protein
MRGRKTALEDEELMGTVNKTRDKKDDVTYDDVGEYLKKTKIMLDRIWIKLEKKDVSPEDLDKYSRLFIMWQKHYFTYKSMLPKNTTVGIVSKLLEDADD